MQALRNERGLPLLELGCELQHGGINACHGLVNLFGRARGRVKGERLIGGERHFDGLGLLGNDPTQGLALGEVGRACLEFHDLRDGLERAPTVDGLLELGEATVEARLGHRWREITQERGRGAALGNGALGRIVRSVDVEVGQVCNEAVGPAGARASRLFAGHELECAVGAKVHHRMQLTPGAKVAIEGRKCMGGRVAVFKEQAHGIALVAKAWLNVEIDIAKAHAQEEEVLAVGELLARCAAPAGLDVSQMGFLAKVVLHGIGGQDIGITAMVLAIAIEQCLANGRGRLGHLDPVAFVAKRLECGKDRFKNREVGGGANTAPIGREVKDHQAHATLLVWGATQ